MSFADGVSGLIADRKEGGTQLPLMLLTMMIDDSTSMSFFNNFQTVMEGHNSVLDVLAASPKAPLFLARTQYMHGKALASGYCPLNQVPRITLENYHLIAGTPLFTASRRILWYVQRRAKEYMEEGNDVRTLTLLLTDGDNREFRKRNTTAQDVCNVVEPMIDSGQHIVAGVGVANPRADFRQVFLDMGIPEQWILTLRSPEEIRAAFGRFSASAEHSSAGRREFDETQVRGFGDMSTQHGK
mgnify:CR=1 FL=1